MSTGVPGRRFLARAWGSELVVFDRSTGDTHVLSEAAAGLFWGATESLELAGSEGEFKPETWASGPAVSAEARDQLGQLGLL